ncbi:DUF4232 domain-containing protein [Streptomyces sp. AJS327]|uniref:DUF4232 domain-containing protein n=1 Tax=Streptomyces sp. AJS327 TaxID=2545265 RepID=UPI0015DF73AE|nr:DUF4232 domain-containing protein [Streptomyces sp. AJS327]MBA0052959.1 DUF4232 domain-containing protein [Streptomyces sp. AJS327]
MTSTTTSARRVRPARGPRRHTHSLAALAVAATAALGLTAVASGTSVAATPGSGTSAVSACAAAGTALDISETGHTTRTLTLTNTSDASCVAAGFPHVSFDPALDGSASWVEDSEPAEPVVLEPGERAYASLIPVYGEGDEARLSDRVVVDLSVGEEGMAEGKPRTLKHEIGVWDPQVTAWQPTQPN